MATDATWAALGEKQMIVWKDLSKNLDSFGLLENFDWSSCKSIADIELKGIPDENIINVLDDYIDTKTYDEDNTIQCNAVKNLPIVEKTIYCAFQYKLEQQNDGLFAVFTGYMSPLLFEIRAALKEIGAVENLALLNDAIKKVNAQNKTEEDFLADVENEELDWLYDDETEDEYSDYLHKLDGQIDMDAENVEDLLLVYIHKNLLAEKN